MRKLQKDEKNKNIRLISVKEAADYMGVGYNTARHVCEECGAILHIGYRVLVDLHVLDKYLDTFPHSSKS